MIPSNRNRFGFSICKADAMRSAFYEAGLAFRSLEIMIARETVVKKILIIALVSPLLAACENQEPKIDRGLAWRCVKPSYDASAP